MKYTYIILILISSIIFIECKDNNDSNSKNKEEIILNTEKQNIIKYKTIIFTGDNFEKMPNKDGLITTAKIFISNVSLGKKDEVIKILADEICVGGDTYFKKSVIIKDFNSKGYFYSYLFNTKLYHKHISDNNDYHYKPPKSIKEIILENKIYRLETIEIISTNQSEGNEKEDLSFWTHVNFGPIKKSSKNIDYIQVSFEYNTTKNSWELDNLEMGNYY